MLLSQGLDPVTGAVGLMITLSSIGIFGFVVLVLISWILEEKITGGQGIAGIAASITAFGICIIAGSSLVTGSIVVATIGLILTYPFASRKLVETELCGYNVELIDRGYQELHLRPGNYPAAFQLARSLFHFGMRGHAIALSEQTLKKISTNIDPMSQKSLRDSFRNEEYELKNWKLISQDPEFFKPIACPNCKRPNAPGFIACQSCQSPYLLEVARQTDPRIRITGKLIMSWAIITLVVPGATFIGTQVPGFIAPIGVVLFAVAIIGFILWRLFKSAYGQTGEVRTSA